jgi:hypothetical protein
MSNNKLKTALLISLIFGINGCSNNVPNNTTDKSTVSSEDNFQDLEKEYSFSSKALGKDYLKRKFKKLLADPAKGSLLVREIVYAGYKYPDLYCTILSEDSGIKNGIKVVPEVLARKNISPAFAEFLDSGCPPTNIIYVKASATGNNDGSSWADAYTSLQDALDHSSVDKKEIWVAAGTYIPSKQTDPDVPRTATFQLISGVNIYGGFAGNESKLSQRILSVANSTIFSGEIGTGSLNDNVYHVVRGANSMTLDGVTVSFGYANGSDYFAQGGGLYNYQVSPTLNNVIFKANFAGFGGGMANDGNLPVLNNVTFDTNNADTGGGMFSQNSAAPVLTNVIFKSNSASGQGGGGMFNYTSTPVLNNVTFTDNKALIAYGGGLCNSSSDAVLNNVTFDSNQGLIGGGMGNIYSSPVLSNVTFSGNSGTYGGGLYNLRATNTSVLNNVLFIGNIAHSGGGIRNDQSSEVLTNVTFYNNSVIDDPNMKPDHNGGGGMHSADSSPVLTNVTFANNSAPDGGAMFNFNPSTSIVLDRVTFFNNLVLSGGRGESLFLDSHATVTAKNSIFYHNNIYVTGTSTLNLGFSDLFYSVPGDGFSTITVTHDPSTDPSGPNFSVLKDLSGNVIVAGTPGAGETDFAGAGNISADPIFKSTTDLIGQDNTWRTQDDGLNLGTGSPAAGAGENGVSQGAY